MPTLDLTMTDLPTGSATGSATGLPRPEPRPDNVPVYLASSEVAQMLGILRGRVFQLREAGWMISPDVVIGPQDPADRPGTKTHDIQGWDYDRVLDFGIETGRLNADAVPIKGNPGGSPLGRPPAHWRANTSRYLDIQAVADLLGLTFDAVYFAHRRHKFVLPALYIGVGNRQRPGWKLPDVRRWAKQNGLPDPAKARTQDQTEPS